MITLEYQKIMKDNKQITRNKSKLSNKSQKDKWIPYKETNIDGKLFLTYKMNGVGKIFVKDGRQYIQVSIFRKQFLNKNKKHQLYRGKKTGKYMRGGYDFNDTINLFSEVNNNLQVENLESNTKLIDDLSKHLSMTGSLSYDNIIQNHELNSKLKQNNKFIIEITNSITEKIDKIISENIEKEDTIKPYKKLREQLYDLIENKLKLYTGTESQPTQPTQQTQQQSPTQQNPTSNKSLYHSKSTSSLFDTSNKSTIPQPPILSQGEVPESSQQPPTQQSQKPQTSPSSAGETQKKEVENIDQTKSPQMNYKTITEKYKNDQNKLYVAVITVDKKKKKIQVGKVSNLAKDYEGYNKIDKENVNFFAIDNVDQICKIMTQENMLSDSTSSQNADSPQYTGPITNEANKIEDNDINKYSLVMGIQDDNKMKLRIMKLNHDFYKSNIHSKIMTHYKKNLFDRNSILGTRKNGNIYFVKNINGICKYIQDNKIFPQLTGGKMKKHKKSLTKKSSILPTPTNPKLNLKTKPIKSKTQHKNGKV